MIEFCWIVQNIGMFASMLRFFCVSFALKMLGCPPVLRAAELSWTDGGQRIKMDRWKLVVTSLLRHEYHAHTPGRCSFCVQKAGSVFQVGSIFHHLAWFYKLTFICLRWGKATTRHRSTPGSDHVSMLSAGVKTAESAFDLQALRNLYLPSDYLT